VLPDYCSSIKQPEEYTYKLEGHREEITGRRSPGGGHRELGSPGAEFFIGSIGYPKPGRYIYKWEGHREDNYDNGRYIVGYIIYILDGRRRVTAR
jgi:hypothetical protein